MWIWKRWAHVWCAVGLVVVGGCCRRGTDDPNAVAHAKMCTAKYGFSAGPAELNLISNCPDFGCGLNGSWLGKGFKFRELRDDGRCNPQGLRVKRFSKAGEPLRLQVENAMLTGVRPGGEKLTGLALENAEIELEHFTSDDANQVNCDAKVAANAAAEKAKRPRVYEPEAQYLLQIVAVKTQPLWVDRSPGTPDPSAFSYLYDFKVTETQDACNVVLCEPGLVEDDVKGVSGTAVIFTGDTYDETTLQVTSSLAPDDAHRFNVACVGTAISKMHLLGHTQAAQTASYQTAVPERQMLLRLLTGDYCGAGVALTEDGVRIGMEFLGGGPKLTTASGFALDGSHPLDALWTADGATCIGTLRAVSDPVALRNQIKSVCESRGHAINLDSCPALSGAPPAGVRGASRAP
jgi:hypothetical protein